MTYTEAIDAIFGAFRERWVDGDATAIAGYLPAVQYMGNTQKAGQDWSKHFAVITQQTVKEEQSTISCCVGENGKRRYTTYGLVFVQLFAPKGPAGQDQCRKLAIIAKSAYRGQTAGDGAIVFRNVRINELEPEENCYRINVVSEYEYDDIN